LAKLAEPRVQFSLVRVWMWCVVVS